MITKIIHQASKFFLVSLILFLFGKYNAIASTNQQEKNGLLIETKLLKPLQTFHDSLSLLDMFAQAYAISTVWKYEMIKEPNKDETFYTYELREYRGVFITYQIRFRVYPENNKITVEDWENKRFVDSKQWLILYKKQKLKL